MLQALRLLDFQRHRETVVRFGPQVTAIVGPTDVGKSSIIRALLWVLTNVPPSDMLRHGASRVEVDLKVDGRMVKRIRGKLRNSYSLDRKEFKAFGKDMPEEIATLLRIGDVNVQGQHDRPFWFGERRTDVSRQLNQIVNLGVIDTTVTAVAGIVRKEAARKEVITERLAAARKTRDELAYVEDMAADMAEVERLAGAHAKAQTAVARLTPLVDAALRHAADAVLAKAQAKGLQEVLLLAEAWFDAGKHVQFLLKWRDEYRKSKSDATTARDLADKAHKEFHAETKNHTCPVCHGKGHL